MCSLGRGFLENIPNKPQPLLLDEDPTEAQLPTMRPFSAQAFQACIQANEINGRVSQEEQLARDWKQLSGDALIAPYRESHWKAHV